MEILEAIKTRRSIGFVSDRPVPREIIEQILEAGTWAPNHFKTEPWQYFVITGDGRKALGEVLAKIAAKEMDDPKTDSNKKKLEKVLEKSFRAPAIIAVAVEPSDNPKVILIEEFGAVYASIQNMLLAAHGLGIGGYWRTGDPCYDPNMKELFGLSSKGEILGFLYFGYPKRNVLVGKRKHFSVVTKWFSDESDFS